MKTYKQLELFHVVLGEREREEIILLWSKQRPTHAFFSSWFFFKRICSQSLYTSGQKQLDSSAFHVIIMKVIYFPWRPHLVTQLCRKSLNGISDARPCLAVLSLT